MKSEINLVIEHQDYLRDKWDKIRKCKFNEKVNYGRAYNECKKHINNGCNGCFFKELESNPTIGFRVK